MNLGARVGTARPHRNCCAAWHVRCLGMVPGPRSHTPFALGKFQKVPEAVALTSETVQLGDPGNRPVPGNASILLRIATFVPPRGGGGAGVQGGRNRRNILIRLGILHGKAALGRVRPVALIPSRHGLRRQKPSEIPSDRKSDRPIGTAVPNSSLLFSLRGRESLDPAG